MTGEQWGAVAVSVVCGLFLYAAFTTEWDYDTEQPPFWEQHVEPTCRALLPECGYTPETIIMTPLEN